MRRLISLALLFLLAVSGLSAQRRQLKIYVVEGSSETKLADIVLELDRHCPGAVVTSDLSAADYSLRIAHNGDATGTNGLAPFTKPYTYILYSSRGTVLETHPAHSIPKAIQQVCKIIGAAPLKRK